MWIEVPCPMKSAKCKKKTSSSIPKTTFNDPDEIIEMDWLMDNIVGRIPEYDELSEEYKLLVINQGIIDVNE